MLERRLETTTLALAPLAVLLCVPFGQPETADDVEAEAAQEVEVYRGSFRSLNGSGVRGEVTVRRSGARLTVRVSARGLPPGAHAQHITTGPTCESYGESAVALDMSLGTIEGAFTFPTTEGRNGRLTYYQEGSHPVFREWDLADRTVVLHAGAPGEPAACAELGKRSE